MTKIYKATIAIEIEIDEEAIRPGHLQVEHLIGGYLKQRYGEYCLVELECSKFKEVEDNEDS